MIEYELNVAQDCLEPRALTTQNSMNFILCLTSSQLFFNRNIEKERLDYRDHLEKIIT